MATVNDRPSLSLTAFSDLEMLSLLVDAADGDGWATAKDIAALPGMRWLQRGHDRPHQAVAVRLSWLWRYGVVEREHLFDEQGRPRYIAGDRKRPKWGQRWRLNEVGEAVVRGHLSAGQLRQLQQIEQDPGRMLQMARWLTEHSRDLTDPTARMVTREWRYGTAKERVA